MATIRLPERVWAAVHQHLFSTPGEHFAFLLAQWAFSEGKPIFLVEDAILVPDEHVTISRGGWELTTAAILDVVNTAVRAQAALIEVHNHGGLRPRFSRTDRAGLQEFPPYILSSLPGRPYGATVWGDATIYGEYFLADGGTGTIDSIIVTGGHFRQLVSRDDDTVPVAVTFDRQILWFTEPGQRALGRLKVAVAGNGGTGSQVLQQLTYLGVRDFTLIDDDDADGTSMNRLVTATAADLGTPKAILGRRLIKSIAPAANVRVIAAKVQSREALEALKSSDLIFGCFDNDAPRLILNELAVAYRIPYFDLAVGIEVEDGTVKNAGGRVAIVVPEGPCLLCMGEIDVDEARFFLSSPEEQAFQVARRYVKGMQVRVPSVVSLNGVVAGIAANEFAIYIAGLRPINVFTELDVFGVARSVKSQWVTPLQAVANPDCLHCSFAGIGDAAGIERYALTDNQDPGAPNQTTTEAMTS
jgi:molybdopterin/thiamine biosynthesis adenylyltransferase/proteasome lid subunit RPN8/RPN11